MNRSSSLRILLNLRPGEGRLIALLLLHSFCLGLAFSFTQTAAFALFLAEFSSQALAWVYVANALMAGLLAIGYGRLRRSVTFRTLLTINLGMLFIITSGLRLGLALSSAQALIFALPIFFQMLVTLGYLSFWPLAARLLSTRQNRRLFQLAGSGQWFALALTGFLIPILVELLGVANLFLLAALGLVGTFAVMRFITRLYPDPIVPAAPEATAVRSPWRNFLRNNYIRLQAALLLVWWLAFFWLDNLFYNRSAAQYTTPEQLASFLGLYLGVLGLAVLLLNLFVTRAALSRWGLHRNLLLLPIGLLINLIAIVILGGIGGALTLIFWATVIAKLLDRALGNSIDLTARTSLYQPLPGEMRQQAQTLVDGIMPSLAAGLAGAGLLISFAIFDADLWPLVIALGGAVVGWIVLAHAAGRQYPLLLIRVLTQRRLSSVELTIGDASSIAILKHELHSPYAGAVVYALNLLEELEPEAMAEMLPALLQHPTAEVRREALERMARLKLSALVPVIQQHLTAEPTLEVCGVAVKALALLGGLAALPGRLSYLIDAPPPLKRGAIVGLLQSDQFEGQLPASGQLFELIDSPDSADRLLAAQILGEVGTHSYYQPLLKLLPDTDPQVTRAALRAAGHLKYPSLWPVVIECLKLPSVRGTATAALVAGGRSTLLEVEAAFAKPNLSRVVLLRLAQVCGRIRGPVAIDLLKSQINQLDARVRSEVLRALTRCGYQATPSEAETIQRYILREAEYAAWLLASSIDCGNDAAATLLQAAFTAGLNLSRERLLDWLSPICDRSIMPRARDNLRLGSPEKRAYALEVIETLVPLALKDIVMPLLEDLTPSQRLHRLSSSIPQLHRGRLERLRIIGGDMVDLHDPWLQACALYCLAQLVQADPNEQSDLRHQAVEIVASATSASDRLVRDTATWVTQVMKAHPGVNAMLSTLERVIILKTVSIFAETPDEILAEVAAICDEIELPAEQTVFEKGDPGDSLYIIVSGQVRVHDDDRLLNYLNERDVFGEMAVLDPETRSASVTTVEETRLLRVDQQALFEVMDDRPEVARGIIQVLSHHLRNRLKDLAELRDRLERSKAV